jgi:Cu+-exporting ATPase
MDRMHEHAQHHEHRHEAFAPSATDPVCGMDVSADSPHQMAHDGIEYRFCSEHCLRKFELRPGQYTRDGSTRPAERKPARPVEYTCPMHPEIVREEPGSCPICGMALDPRIVSDEAEQENPELSDMRRRLWLATLFTVPLLVVAMGASIPAFERWLSTLMPMQTRVWLELGLATPVCLWSAWPFYARAVASVKHRSLNMFTLIRSKTTRPRPSARCTRKVSAS